MENKLKLPTNYKEALMQLLERVEENERLKEERDIAIARRNKIGSLREAQALANNSNLQRENNKLRSKAQAFDTMVDFIKSQESDKVIKEVL